MPVSSKRFTRTPRIGLTRLQEFFAGQGATGFFDAQTQMLSGLQGLIDTVHQHGQTTTQVLGNAIGTDHPIGGLF